MLNLGEDIVVEQLQDDGNNDAEDGGDECHFHARSHDGGADVAGTLNLVKGHHHANHRAEESQRGGYGYEEGYPGASFLQIGALHRAVVLHAALNVVEVFVDA